MSRAETYLALCLLDAIEDKCIDGMRVLLEKHKANPNTIVLEKDVAPIHLVIGADELCFAEKATALMLQYGGNANLPTSVQLVTPLHVAANLGRTGIVKLLLQAGGIVEHVDDDGRTPIEHAIEEGHFEVVQLLQNYIFEQKMEQKRKGLQQKQQHLEKNLMLSPSMRLRKGYGERMPPGKALPVPQALDDSAYTPNKEHYNFDVTSPYYVNITHRRKNRFKPLNKTVNTTLFPDESITSERENTPPAAMGSCEEIVTATPPVTERTNLFELTERNLQNFTRQEEPASGRRMSFVACWREKVAELRERDTISRKLDDIDRMLNLFSDSLAQHSFMDAVEETFITATEQSKREQVLESEHESVFELECEPRQAPELDKTKSEDDLKDEPIDPQPKKDHEIIEEIPATDESIGEHNTSNLGTVIVQISEEYIHTDDEAGVVFREKKMTTVPIAQTALAVPKVQILSEEGEIVFTTIGKGLPNRNPSLSSQSTAVTLPPLDYDTDALRVELTNFGEPPGPITKGTKKLYLRKLIKFRRHPERLAARSDTVTPNYSVELMATVRREDVFAKIIDDYQRLEQEMANDFQSVNPKVARTLREGHLKKSFIYLLIDPCISDNLPAQQQHLEPHELWKRFLASVFYVGKGKSSRPYCHLYDAMKLYQQRDDAVVCPVASDEKNPSDELVVEEEEIIFQFEEEKVTNDGHISARHRRQQGARIVRKRQLAPDSRKLNRIIDVWGAGKGVVCLHVFHNIMPAEAYTREAAIIDAIGLPNLTNLKRGDYYGKSLSWPMKQRKHLGMLLLRKALLIYLAEGETQLLPSDLI
ncbi:uncharacterized protein LOC131206588 [Anopheles bellator]|uniref:uncharacterized protein LOC131206588 n=1 Tax=Anopheles bellator TaxID=139047 RepID=UPI002647BD70|nr:uncharacterized protein LOC131206588 [Anopheles bellator]